MKKSVIREVYYGNRGRFDLIETTEEYKKLSDKTSEAMDELCKGLPPEQKAKFNAVCDFIADENSEYEDTVFAEGFKLGLMIGIECSEE